MKRDVEEERIEEAVEIEEPDRKKAENCNCKNEHKQECEHEHKHEYENECECSHQYEYDYGNGRMMLAHAYVRWQHYDEAFNPQEALKRGTLFPDLYGVYPIPK